jgi:hypothetical protein
MEEPTKAELQAERYRMALESILSVYEKGTKAYEIAKNAVHGKLASSVSN